MRFQKKELAGRLLMVAEYMDPSGLVHTRGDTGYSNGLKKVFKIPKKIPLRFRPFFMKVNCAQRRLIPPESSKKLARHLFSKESTKKRFKYFKTKNESD